MAEGRKKRLKVMVAVDESDVSLYALKWTLENLFKNPAASAGEEIPVMEPDPEQGMVTVVHVHIERKLLVAFISCPTSISGNRARTARSLSSSSNGKRDLEATSLICQATDATAAKSADGVQRYRVIQSVLRAFDNRK
ncbi:hypothetical protein L1987_49194 [Smallanthus sonchifolius]|uniref:Uncharacterized protein n=1 Tax=Smallanthus sonchifolius TaxID=185202 RepID=A0ACB9FV15_9ASTR|nr:hypothetical protein L1987_49194 [Smallanthus sonchifolius]